MTGTTDGYVYTRMFNGTSWGNWSKVFTDLTDGSGSGLDADLLAGQSASFYSDIVSSGSSGDHHWVKFKDGTLWKYGTFTFSGTVSTAWGSLYTNASAQTLTFDTTVPFTTIPDVHFTP